MCMRVCAYSCHVLLFALGAEKKLCHVNINESSQDFNGNIISCLFVLSLAHGVFSLPAVIQHRERDRWKSKLNQVKDSFFGKNKYFKEGERKQRCSGIKRMGLWERKKKSCKKRAKFSSSSLDSLTLNFILFQLFNLYLFTNAFIVAPHLLLSSSYDTHTFTLTTIEPMMLSVDPLCWEITTSPWRVSETGQKWDTARWGHW